MPYLTPDETQDWLQARLSVTGILTISELARVTGINKGTLSKYFKHKQRPSIDTLMILCRGLGVTPLEMLQALGAVDALDS